MASSVFPNSAPTFARAHRGFSLVELLAVMGIIALLIGLLLPTLARARERASQTKCASNLHEIGLVLQIYINDNHGWLFPVGPASLLTGLPTTLGTNMPPNLRWPMYAKFEDLKNAPYPPPYNPALYNPMVWNEAEFPSALYTPKVMLCPSDINPAEGHSYMLNQHLADKEIKANSDNFGGVSNSQVVVMGEKQTLVRDYYMEANDYLRTVELYRHGPVLGSNYLFFDTHVAAIPPTQAGEFMDPWDVISNTTSTTQPQS